MIMKAASRKVICLKLAAALACVLLSCLTGCSHTDVSPLAAQSQAQYMQQEQKSAADYSAYIRAHGRPGQ